MKLIESVTSEISSLAAMEKQSHASAFINPLTAVEHQAAFQSSKIVYLTIIGDANKPVGYIVIALEDDGNTAEFRRIIVDRKHRGVGQTAIRLMEEYCKDMLNRSRVWLDVYEDNVIGIHIYEKFGYQNNRNETVNGRILRYYSKSLI